MYVIGGVAVQAWAMLESREVLNSMHYVLSNKQQLEGSLERESRRCKQPRKTEQHATRLDGESSTDEEPMAQHLDRRLQLVTNRQVRFHTSQEQSALTAACKSCQRYT